MAKVRILVSAKGDPQILDVCGVGENCIERSKKFEQMLGQAKEETRTLTDSYYEQLPPQTLEQEEGNG